MSADDQTQALSSDPSIQWFMSALTCPAESAPKFQGDAGLCPKPEKCKGDVYYNTSLAAYDMSVDELKTRTSGPQNVFQNSPNQGGAQ